MFNFSKSIYYLCFNYFNASNFVKPNSKDTSGSGSHQVLNVFTFLIAVTSSRICVCLKFNVCRLRFSETSIFRSDI